MKVVGYINTLPELTECNQLLCLGTDILHLIVDYSMACIDTSTCILVPSDRIGRICVKMFRTTLDEEPSFCGKEWYPILGSSDYNYTYSRMILANQTLFVTGLFNFVESRFVYNIAKQYDFREQEWTTLKPMIFEHCHHAMAIHDGRIYIFGGSNGNEYHVKQTRNCEVYSPTLCQDEESFEWRPLPPMRTPRMNHVAIVHTSKGEVKIYIFGGVKKCERFDIQSESWDPMDSIADMPLELIDCKGVAMGNFIYVMGGKDKFSTVVSNVFKYDVMMNTWTEERPLPRPRYNFYTGALDENRVVISGGDNEHHGMDKFCWIMRPNTGTYEEFT